MTSNEGLERIPSNFNFKTLNSEDREEVKLGSIAFTSKLKSRDMKNFQTL